MYQYKHQSVEQLPALLLMKESCWDTITTPTSTHTDTSKSQKNPQHKDETGKRIKFTII